jgi:hypothetical protein
MRHAVPFAVSKVIAWRQLVPPVGEPLYAQGSVERVPLPGAARYRLCSACLREPIGSKRGAAPASSDPCAP